MKKYQLYELVERHKTQEKVYRIVMGLKINRLSVLRLPLYMCDLKQIERDRAKVKQVVKENNIQMDLSSTKLETMATN